MAAFGSLKQRIFDKEARKQQYQAYVRGLNAYDRHKKFLNDYAGFYGKESSSQEKLPIKTDQDTLREGYRFIRSEEDDMNSSWEQRLVKRYYDKLFKEYCLADMSQYKSGKIGLRWRTEKEVISGKGESKQALVKLVTCERCADKLFYKKRKEKARSREKDEEEQTKKQSRQKDKEEVHRRKRERSESDDDTGEEYDGRKDKRKGRKASTSKMDDKLNDDENFDEYLQGMFP